MVHWRGREEKGNIGVNLPLPLLSMAARGGGADIGGHRNSIGNGHWTQVCHCDAYFQDLVLTPMHSASCFCLAQTCSRNCNNGGGEV